MGKYHHTLTFPIALLVLMLSACISEPAMGETEMKTIDLNLWQTIDASALQILFTQAKMESVLNTQFFESDNGANNVFRFFDSKPVRLKDKIIIFNADLHLKRQRNHPGFMVLNLSGSCLSLQQVRTHYSDLKLTEIPSGAPLDEEVTYSVQQPWGNLSFGFKDRNAQCLTYVAMDTD